MKFDPEKDSTLPGSWDGLWTERSHIPPWDYLSHIILAEIQPLCGKPGSGWILEAGSGSGRISKRLSRSGFTICQMDNSIASLVFNRRNDGGDARLLAGDIRQVPIQDNALDIVWSSGVLEHFRGDGLTGAIRDLARIVRPGGRIISFVPYSRCLPYRAAKWLLERIGRWPYGREDPLDSLRDNCRAAGLEVEWERTTAFSALGIQNLQYLPGLRALGWWSNGIACRLHDIGLLRLWDRVASQLFGGYLLLCVARKPRA